MVVLGAVVSVFAEAEDEPYRTKLERWLPRGADMGSLLLRLGTDAPADYAHAQTRRPFDDTFEEHRTRHDRWRDTIRRAGIRRLYGGVLALRPRSGPTPPWWKENRRRGCTTCSRRCAGGPPCKGG